MPSCSPSHSEILAELAAARQEAADARQKMLQAQVAHDQLARVFEQAPALIAVTSGPEHVFTFRNSAYQALFPGRELIGATVRAALPELEGQGVFEMIDGVYRTGEPFIGNQVPMAFDHGRNGTIAHHAFNFVYQPSRNLAGEVDGILVHAVEVTAQVEAQRVLSGEKERVEAEVHARTQELQASNAQLRELAAALTQGEAILSLQGRVLAQIAEGAPLPDVLTLLTQLVEVRADGMLCSILLYEDGRLRHGAAPSLPDAYNQVIDGVAVGPGVGSCGTAAFTRQRVVVSDIATDPLWKDFKDVALSHGLQACWSTPILDSEGAVIGTFALYYSAPRHPSESQIRLTEVATHLAGVAIQRTLAEVRITRQVAELKQADRAKDEFLSILSHELRTPINAMIGFGSVLGDELAGPLNEKQRLYTSRMLAASDALLALVTDLLDMSSIQAGKLTILPESISLPDVVDDVLINFGAMAASRRITMASRIDASLPNVLADKRRLGQVLSNLVGNSLKFIKEGDMIEVRAHIDSGFVRVEVADNGPGIAADDQGRAFEPFTQVDMSSTRRVGGVGLGLTICRSLVEAHGGQIGLDSASGAGATFWFTLPAMADRAI